MKNTSQCLHYIISMTQWVLMKICGQLLAIMTVIDATNEYLVQISIYVTSQEIGSLYFWDVTINKFES